MRTLLRILLVVSPTLAFGTAAYFYLRTSKPDGPLPPEGLGAARLVVVVSFDQMRGNYLDRYEKLFGPDGFERLKREGAWYSEAHLPYANSYTGPGHASLATGVPPSVHGIIMNDWYDRAEKRDVTTVDWPQYYKVPGGRPGSGSFAPDRLMVSTVGENLRNQRPRTSKVVTISIKERSACLMAGKRADGVYCFDSETGGFYTSSYYAERLPAWVEAFNARRVPDQWFRSTWNHLLDPAIYDDYVGKDARVGENPGKENVFPHVLTRGDRPGRVFYENLETSPMGNDLLWEFAKAAIQNEKLGAGDASHMLFISYSSNDRIGHAWGPDSHEVMDVTLRSDRLIADMLKYLDETVGVGRYSFFVSADHGVCPLPEVSVKEHPTAERFSAAGELDGLGEYLDEKLGPVGSKPHAWFESQGFPEIYLNRRLIKAKDKQITEVEELAAGWAGNRSHMQTAFTRTQLEGPPLKDEPDRRVQLSFYPSRSGDIFLVNKPYCSPLGKISTGATHGSPHSYDTHIPVLMAGAGIPALGKIDEPTSSLIFAPTMYHVLGLTPPAFLFEKVPEEIAKPPAKPESDDAR